MRVREREATIDRSAASGQGRSSHDATAQRPFDTITYGAARGAGAAAAASATLVVAVDSGTLAAGTDIKQRRKNNMPLVLRTPQRILSEEILLLVNSWDWVQQPQQY